MTKDQAVNLAAKWWYTMIRSGLWNKGDDALFTMSEDDYGKLRAGLKDMVQQCMATFFIENVRTARYSLFANYGFEPLQKLYNSLGFDVTVPCPQMAGCIIIRIGEEWKVEVKTGFRHKWRTLTDQ